MLRYVFFGTPSFSTKVLDALESAGMSPALVITAPDKPRGRGLELASSPVKAWALERGIDVIQPQTLKDKGDAFLSKKASPLSGLEALFNTDWDVFIVAAYAKLLPQTVLDIPKHGCLNIHPSLLPRFRGASPVISAILADERETGVTIMAMTAEMDAGPVVAAARIEIAEEDWPPPASELTDLLFAEGGNLLAETLPLWIQGKVEPTPQDGSLATFTKKFSADDAWIDLSPTANAREQFLKIRAFDRNPRAHFFARRDGGQAQKDGERIRVIITESSWLNDQLVLEKVIPEGKKEISYKDFLASGAIPEKKY